MHGWQDKIILGDCIEVLSKADSPFADLVFADPPFNIGYKYDKYYDRVKSKNYIAWTRDWMTRCANVLKPDGSFYIAIGDDFAANVRIIGDEIGLHLRNWIIWHYTFGQQTKTKFARSHTHIFYFVKDKDNFKFNDHAVRVPSDRTLIYNDRRANPIGKMPDDVWTQHSRVCGTFKERQGWHPCQMPESLLETIIAASSDKHDTVLDPFSGSGTTAAAACKLARHYVGIEMSEQYADKSRDRLGALEKNKTRFSESAYIETNEAARLLKDMAISPDALTKNEKLLDIFSSQLSKRLNNTTSYQPQDVIRILKKADLEKI